jgi:hypothetical protein
VYGGVSSSLFDRSHYLISCGWRIEKGFLSLAEESQPGRPARALSRPVVMGENPSNHVFVDCKVEGQGDLFSDSRTTPAGIALLHFDDRMD